MLMKLRRAVTPVAVLFCVLISACATDLNTASTFRFPIVSGNIEDGRAAFIKLECHQCHTVSGIELPSFDGASPLSLELGGQIHYVKTYAELVTSIINPNHVISDEYLRQLPREARRQTASPMPFKDQMTVVQLIDLVTLLNSRYVVLEGYEDPGSDDAEDP